MTALGKHLYTPGPVNMPEAVRRAVDVPLEDHRAPDFPQLILPLLEDLKKVFRTETGNVLLFNGSGTGGWEAAISNCLSPGDKVLTARYGHFSHLWIEMCGHHGLEVQAIEGIWGQGAPISEYAAALSADKDHQIKAVLICHNETATGVVSDVAELRRVMDDLGHPALLFADGVSSIASLEFRMEDWGVDVAVCGSQKGFMLPTGLGIVGVSQKALEATKSATCPRSFFDFQTMLKFNADGYFPYTPATTLIHGLRQSVNLLLTEGMDNVHARHRHMAEGVRAAVAAWELDLCARDPRWYSDTVSAICVPAGTDANKVVRAAYENYGLSLGGGLSQLAGKVFRIGHMGRPSELNLLSAIAGAEMAMRDAGMHIELGSGVAAAQAVYRPGQGAGHDKCAA